MSAHRRLSRQIPQVVISIRNCMETLINVFARRFMLLPTTLFLNKQPTTNEYIQKCIGLDWMQNCLCDFQTRSTNRFRWLPTVTKHSELLYNAVYMYILGNATIMRMSWMHIDLYENDIISHSSGSIPYKHLLYTQVNKELIYALRVINPDRTVSNTQSQSHFGNIFDGQVMVKCCVSADRSNIAVSLSVYNWKQTFASLQLKVGWIHGRGMSMNKYWSFLIRTWIIVCKDASQDNTK